MTYFGPIPKSSIDQDRVMQYVQRNAHTFYQQLTLRGIGVTNLTASGTLVVAGHTTLATLGVTGAAALGSTLTVAGHTTLATLWTSGNSSIGGDLTITGEAYFASGSATVPSIAFSADNSLGIYRAAAGELAFASTGAEVLRVDQGGITDHKDAGVVKGRAQNLGENTISTTETTEETCTLAIPADWNTYDIEALVQTDVLESGTLTAIRVVTLSIKTASTVGTTMGLTQVEISTVDPNRWSGVVHGYLTNQTTTGNRNIVFTTVIPGDTGQASTDNTTFIATAWRTS